jgi:predicted nucleic-acid-binding Zn-ribbon protein
MGIIDSFNQGFSGDETQRYSVAGLPVTCSHCGGEDFDEGSSQLNTAGMTFLNLDWANQSATVLTCKRCGHVDWFLQEPERR